MRPVSSVYLLIPRPVWEFKYRTGEKERGGGGGEDEERETETEKKRPFGFIGSRRPAITAGIPRI